jgi:chromosome segregation ATPase
MLGSDSAPVDTQSYATLEAELAAARAQAKSLEDEKQSLVTAQQRQLDINKDTHAALERSRTEVASLKKDIESTSADNKTLKAKLEHTQISAKTAADTYSKDTAELKNKLDAQSKELSVARSKTAELQAALSAASASKSSTAAEQELAKKLESSLGEIATLKARVEQLEKEKRAADITARRASRMIDKANLELRSPDGSGSSTTPSAAAGMW